MLTKSRWPDRVWLTILAGYILAGTAVVPFHGDESTTIWMSRDYAYIFLDRDLSRVRYSDPPISATEQHLRLITGSLTKYLIGFAWHLDGQTIDSINEQWDWGADWNYNLVFGHAPDDRLLMLGRLPSAFMLASGVFVLFGIARNLGGRRVAFLASLYYVLNPALLLNGRRAMFEGGLVLFSLLVIWVAIGYLRNRNWWLAILLGMVSGLAISAKHPAAFTLLPVYAVCGMFALITSYHPRIRLIYLSQLLISAVLALLVFYILNPVWWNDPFARLEEVIEARTDLLEGQVAAFGHYENTADQIAGFFRQTFIVFPQYYEVDEWQDYIADEIARYEKTPYKGISIGGSQLGAFLVASFYAIGLGLSIHAAFFNVDPYTRQSSSVIAVWSIFMLVTSGILVPLEWQRYFLMMHLTVSLITPIGIIWVWNRLRIGIYGAIYRRTSNESDSLR